MLEPSAAKTILIIDDDAMNREVMEAFLELEDFNVLTAHNGQMGLDIARQQLPNLIILDIRLPDMEGYQVAQSLRHQPLTRQIPILVITGFDDDEVRHRALAAGATAFMNRPFESEIYIETVKRLIADG